MQFNRLPQNASSPSFAKKKGFGGRKGPIKMKKMTIKPFKIKPKPPDNFEEKSLMRLTEAVTAVHKKESVKYSFEELYRSVEDLCRHKKKDVLYNKLKAQCDCHIGTAIMNLRGKTDDTNLFLQLVETCWNNHCGQMSTIRDIFLYLDRTYVIQTAEVRSLWDMGLQLFCKHLKLNEEVERKTIHSLLFLIESERKQESINRSLVKTLLRMLIALGIYQSSFEIEFLDATETYYHEEGHRLIHRLSIPDYLAHVSERLRQEHERVNLYLDPRSRRQLIIKAEDQMVKIHVDTILNKGFADLMTNDRKEHLQRMYSLINAVGELDRLQRAFGAYIQTTGTDIVTDKTKDKTMVQSLLTFKGTLDSILAEAFKNNDEFKYALKQAFEAFINQRQNRPAELIAKFLDKQLKQGNKGPSEEELEDLLKQVLVIFQYIHGKDVFEAFYKKDLAKRLLLNKSASEDAEKSMIAKLKTECGSSFTNKLEGMFKDIELSKDIMQKFASSCSGNDCNTDFDINVHVLTTSSWPEYTPMEVKLPPQVKQEQESFRKFYLAKHSGRKLTWMSSLTHCILRADFKNGRKEIAVSAFQAIVLMLFNQKDILSFQEIQEASGIEEDELKRTLTSLALGKRDVRLLLKKPKSADVKTEDKFKINKDFKSKLYRIKINSIQIKETKEENSRTNERVFQDRQYQIDACIVRIMKARKTLKHPLLMSEVFKQLKFPATPLDLKKRIESLLSREYIERDKDNAQVYNYLA